MDTLDQLLRAWLLARLELDSAYADWQTRSGTKPQRLRWAAAIAAEHTADVALTTYVNTQRAEVLAALGAPTMEPRPPFTIIEEVA